MHTWIRAIGAAAEHGDVMAAEFPDAPLETRCAVLEEDHQMVD